MRIKTVSFMNCKDNDAMSVPTPNMKIDGIKSLSNINTVSIVVRTIFNVQEKGKLVGDRVTPKSNSCLLPNHFTSGSL